MATQEVEELVSKILSSSKIEDILNIGEFDTEYKRIIAVIHPDRCDRPDAPKASARLNELRDIFVKGKSYRDDIGEYRTNGYWVKWTSDKPAVKWSFENHARFKALKEPADIQFAKYIPEGSELLAGNEFKFTFAERTIPLSGLTLSQEHVNWVLNRLLEYCSYMAQIGFSHGGLTPESVFLVPSNHGIKVCSFYHLARLGNRVKTISAKYSEWYPSELFTNKVGITSTDVEMSKRIAAYLLGDKSGAGVKLKKTHNEKFVNFILKHHDNPYQALIEYRELLKANFKKEFHVLSL